MVVVADAGRDRAAPSADEILARPDGRFGFRVADPATGARRGRSPTTRCARRAARRRGRAPPPLLRRDDPREGEARRGGVGGRTEGGGCSNADRLGARSAGAACARGPDRRAGRGRERRRPLPRTRRPGRTPQAATRVAVAESRSRGSSRCSLRTGSACAWRPPCRSTAPAPTPPAYEVTSLSYSALALWERCSYRYFAERIAGMRPREHAHAPKADDADAPAGLAATEIGDAVHVLLEGLDLERPAPPAAAELAASVRERYPDVSASEPRPHRRARGGVLRLRARAPAGRSRRHRGRALLRLRARRCASPRPLRCDRPDGSAHCGGRLQDERPRRGRACRRRRARVPAAAARLRARPPPRRGGRGGGRVLLPSSGPPSRSRRSSHAPTRPRFETELSAAVARIRAGDFGRRPGSSSAAVVPRSTSSAPDPRLRAPSSQ